MTNGEWDSISILLDKGFKWREPFGEVQASAYRTLLDGYSAEELLVVVKTLVARGQEQPAPVSYGCCQCGCGQKAPISEYSAASRGYVKGQPKRFVAGHQRTTHGQAGRGARSLTYRTWQSMITRCANPNASRYERWGGRGIIVCERWQTFTQFLADMGERPSPEHSIDRIDNDGNYEPGNCRWATHLQQWENRHPSHCPHGHEYAPENTYLRRSDGARQCKACMSAAAKEKRRLVASARQAEAIARGDTRAQKVAKAQEFRAQGLTLREIGQRLGGLSEGTISGYLSDPDGSKERAGRLPATHEARR